MEHEPCRLLSDPDGLGDLVAANAVLAIGEHPDHYQPFLQRDWGILEYGSDLCRKLAVLVGALALPLTLGREIGHVLAATDGTSHDAIRPALRCHVIDTVLRVGVVQDCLLESLWFHMLASNLEQA
jgi:hypothetical protein